MCMYMYVYTYVYKKGTDGKRESKANMVKGCPTQTWLCMVEQSLSATRPPN